LRVSVPNPRAVSNTNTMAVFMQKPRTGCYVPLYSEVPSQYEEVGFLENYKRENPQLARSRLVLSRWRVGRYRVACLRGACPEHREGDLECEPQGGSHDRATTTDVGGTPASQLFRVHNSRLHPHGQTVRGVFR